MAKKQVTFSNEAAATAAVPALAVKSGTPRNRTVKHKAAAIVESPVSRQQISHDEIAKVAYSYWESRGCQGGDPLDDWFRAEAELGLVTAH